MSFLFCFSSKPTIVRRVVFYKKDFGACELSIRVLYIHCTTYEWLVDSKMRDQALHRYLLHLRSMRYIIFNTYKSSSDDILHSVYTLENGLRLGGERKKQRVRVSKVRMSTFWIMRARLRSTLIVNEPFVCVFFFMFILYCGGERSRLH